MFIFEIFANSKIADYPEDFIEEFENMIFEKHADRIN